jgi:hypothetical protein
MAVGIILKRADEVFRRMIGRDSMAGGRNVLLRVSVCYICLIVLMVVDFFQRYIKWYN